MPTKRTRTARPAALSLEARINPELVDVYRRIRAMRDAGDDDRNRDQYIALLTQLHLGLGLRPWECDPFDVHDGPPPSWANAAEWEKGQARLEAFEELAGDVAD